MAMRPGTLEVGLECASGLKVSVFRTTYVIVSCGGQQRARSRSAVAQGWKPTFNELLSFRVDGSTPEITITVFNQRIFSQDEELGSIRIPLANLFHGACPAKLPSTLYALTSASSGQHQGDLRLSLSYTPFSAQGSTSCQSSGPWQASRLHGNEKCSNPSAPYVPSFRSNQGRRPEAELREIASHALTIPPLDWIRLVAKLDTADVVQLEQYISPDDHKTLEARASQIPQQEILNLMMQLDASDLKRCQALQRLAEAKQAKQPQPKAPARTAAEQLQMQNRQIQLLNQVTRMADANTKFAAERSDFVNAIGTDFRVEYSYDKPKKNTYSGVDFMSDI